MKKVNPLIKWWVTPLLPTEDILAKHNFITQWFVHPIKRRLSRVYLSFLRSMGKIKVVGITGSTGKTTTTEILASILKVEGETVWSKVGVDPVYNIPNTILRAKPSTKYLILEMSVEYKNEMDYYLWLSHPDIGIITNVDLTHTEYLGSKEDVAFEKGKLVRKLSKDGAAILNNNDKLVKALGKKTDAKCLYFGEGGDVFATNIKFNENLGTDFTLNIGNKKKFVQMGVYGKQFVSNAIAASAAASALGVGMDKIVQGLEDYQNQPHRLNIFRINNTGIIMDDTYNSNPKAAAESLDTFDNLAKNMNKVAIIGDMLELGKYDEVAHRDLGKIAGEIDLSALIGVGNSARFIVEEASKKMGQKRCYLVNNYEEALEIVKPMLNKNTALFVKGSRSIHLDKLVDALR